MSRTSGKKIVSMAFAGIVGVLGVANIYLPYMADRDKLRGMFEEDDMPEQAKHELDMMMKVEKAASQAKSSAESANNESSRKGPGSMWSNLRRN